MPGDTSKDGKVQIEIRGAEEWLSGSEGLRRWIVPGASRLVVPVPGPGWYDALTFTGSGELAEAGVEIWRPQVLH